MSWGGVDGRRWIVVKWREWKEYDSQSISGSLLKESLYISSRSKWNDFEEYDPTQI